MKPRRRRQIIATPLAVLGLAGSALATPGMFHHARPPAHARAIVPGIQYHTAQLASARGACYGAELASASGMPYQAAALATVHHAGAPARAIGGMTLALMYGAPARAIGDVTLALMYGAQPGVCLHT